MYLCPLVPRSQIWRGTCPPWLYGSGAYEGACMCEQLAWLFSRKFDALTITAAGRVRSIVMSMYVCLSVHSRNSKTTRPNFTKCLLRVACGWGSILLWWRCDTLCNFGFVDDVVFSHNGLMVLYAYLRAAIEHDYHNRRDFNQILQNDKDRKYSHLLSVRCAPGRGGSLLSTTDCLFVDIFRA